MMQIITGNVEAQHWERPPQDNCQRRICSPVDGALHGRCNVAHSLSGLRMFGRNIKIVYSKIV
jgi:hypothetical protein